MANTYELIKGETLTTTAASYTFSAIPSTYTDLILKISARTTSASTQGDNTNIQFNGSSAALYGYRSMYVQNGGSPAVGSGTNATAGINQQQSANRDGTTATTFSNYEIYIPNYTAAIYKPIPHVSAVESNTATTVWGMAASAGLWRDNSAITSITLTTNTLMSGSSFYLYGVKNA
jgi:hypothetical protein